MLTNSNLRIFAEEKGGYGDAEFFWFFYQRVIWLITSLPGYLRTNLIEIRSFIRGVTT
jgi:hypothetical protein